jgi:hypothetical protein
MTDTTPLKSQTGVLKSMLTVAAVAAESAPGTLSSSMVALRRALAFAAFLLYAAAAVVAVREHPSAWALEHEGSLPAAISHAVYGAPLGQYDTNVYAVFFDLTRTGVTAQSVEQAVEETARGTLRHGGTVIPNEGIGAGQPLFMGFAAALFGPHLLSFTYLFLVLMGAATIAFIVRFSDGRLFMVPLTFAALSVMLLTPMMFDQEVLDSVPIGGNRYFGMLGVLPALHLYFDLREGRAEPSPKRPGASVVQVVLLMLVILARSSSAYLLGLIALGVLARLRADWSERSRRLTFLREARRLLVVAVISLAIMVALVPDFLLRGRAFGHVWHRAFVSLALHPDWPFGNLRAVYDCTKFIPQGLNRKHPDDNGMCVWWAYPPNRVKPPGELVEKVYGPEYQALMRSTLFEVIRSYPRQAWELYTYYKPLMVWQTLRRAFEIEWRGASAPLLWLVSAQTFLFLGFTLHDALAQRSKATWPLGAIPILFVLSLPSQFVAWSSLWTGADVVFCMYCLIGATLALAVRATVQTIAGAAGKALT